MSAEAAANVREFTSAPVEEGKRRGRKPAAERSGEVIARFFLGESSSGKIQLITECKGEAEAQLASLLQEKPYFRSRRGRPSPTSAREVLLSRRKPSTRVRRGQRTSSEKSPRLAVASGVIF